MEYFHFVIHNWIYLFSCRSYMDNDGDENKMAIFMIEIWRGHLKKTEGKNFYKEWKFINMIQCLSYNHSEI